MYWDVPCTAMYAQVQYMCLTETRDDQRRPAVKCAEMSSSCQAKSRENGGGYRNPVSWKL